MIEVIDDQGLFDVIGIILPAAISLFLAMVVKFSFSKKVTKIWHNLPQGFDIT